MPRALRVALCDAYPELRGGAQAHLSALARGLGAAGVAVRVVTCAPGPLAEATAGAGLPTVVVPATGALAARGGGVSAAVLASLPGYWRRVRHALTGADVVHVQDHRGAAMFAPAARWAGARVLWNVHALQPGVALNRACAAPAADVVTPTEAAATALSAVTGRDVGVVPCALRAPSVSWPGPGEGPARRISTVARMHPAKGLETLLEAAAALRDARWPELRVEIVGGADPASPATAARLRDRAGRPDLAGAVTFHGHLGDPWEVAATADAYVQPSRRENQALALREAMAAGMPVVASDLPTIREAVTAGETGLLAAAGEPAALASSLDRVLSDTDLARRLGAAAAARPPPGSAVPAMLRRYRGLAGR